ncbi:MAG TPA: hypothetical protein VHR18_03570 [Solirubrobacterales bacterium]|jgi:hypothetical protein|nr:hypothetical protein [Solirubrobacterales bacterium]
MPGTEAEAAALLDRFSISTFGGLKAPRAGWQPAVEAVGRLGAMAFLELFCRCRKSMDRFSRALAHLRSVSSVLIGDETVKSGRAT